jgi:hypothetical protein
LFPCIVHIKKKGTNKTLDKYIREVREELEKEVDKGNLQSELVFILSQELDALFVKYYNENFKKEKRKKPNEAVANFIINRFLRQKNLDIGLLKYRENARCRNELIVKMRAEAGFSIRETARYLGLNRGLVYISMKKFKRNPNIEK